MARRIPPYDEFRFRLNPRGDGAYHVHVQTAAGATANGSFHPPYNDDQLELLRAKLNPRTRGVRGVDSPEYERGKAFGAALWDALIVDDPVRDVFAAARRSAKDAGRNLRITLSLSAAPELMSIPWELLYRRPGFLAMSVQSPVVRYLDLDATVSPLQVEPPLQILGMVSSPSDAEHIDADAERANLERALEPLTTAGRVQVRWLDNGTLTALQQEADHGADFHVFHYIGHGAFSPTDGQGCLLLEGLGGHSEAVSGERLGSILCDRGTLRLAVLNACEGAASAGDPLAGVATSLVEYEVPAVIGMQFAISDNAAIAFAKEFYSAIAASFPVDAAVTAARRALATGHAMEWVTPVLFMRVADGRLFEMTDALPAPPAPKSEPAPPPEPAPVQEPAPEPAPPPPAPDPRLVRTRRMVRELVEAGEWEPALTAAREGIASAPRDEELIALRDEARRGRERERRARAAQAKTEVAPPSDQPASGRDREQGIEAVIPAVHKSVPAIELQRAEKEIRRHVDAGEWDAALAQIKTTLAAFPVEGVWRDPFASHIKGVMATEDRPAETGWRSGATATGARPGAHPLTRLLEEARQGKRRDEEARVRDEEARVRGEGARLDRLRSTARAHASAGRWPQALAAAEEGLRLAPRDRGFQALRRKALKGGMPA
jgi:hypothetical protein